MSFFGKLKKFARKLARPALAVATGGMSERVISAAKGLGIKVHRGSVGKANSVLQTKLQPVSVRAVIARESAPIVPITRMGTMARLSRKNGAVTMPGGAPLSSSRTSSTSTPRRRRSRRASGSNGAPNMSKRTRSAGRKGGSGGDWRAYVKAHSHIRQANGMLDLKRIAAMRRAGEP